MNKDLFKTNPGNIKSTNGFLNEAGGKAYAFDDAAALTQLVLTGTFNGTFYSTETDQLKQVLELVNKVDVEFVAKLAVYARKNGLMKDTPALLTAYVAAKNTNLLKRIFPLVIDDPKMLRNFVQTIRSGVVGRKSLGTAPKKLIQNYLNGLTDEQLFRANIGNDPSLSDIIKMVHPKATNSNRNALYAYILGKKYEEGKLLPLAIQFENFKKDQNLEIPNVPFQMLTALPLTDDQWKTIARNASWNQIRHNLNTFLRHNVFTDKEIVSTLANRLQNREEILRAKVFPYQLFSTFMNISDDVPSSIRLALQAAMETAIENVPSIEGNVKVLLDVSGSMNDPITGKRGLVSTKVKCIDVASLIAASIVRKNPETVVIPFDTVVKKVVINPLDSVMTNSAKLAAAGANGATKCEAPLMHLNENNDRSNVLVMISDNQSFVQSVKTFHGETVMMREWSKFKNRNKGAKLICLDIAPYANSQVYDTNDTLNCGGFSDQVFDVISQFVKDGNKEILVKRINSVEI